MVLQFWLMVLQFWLMVIRLLKYIVVNILVYI